MSKSTKIVLWLVLAIVVIAGVWYGVNRKTSMPVEKGAIKIGFATPLTGDAASWGLPAKEGAEIAADKINAEGGIDGRKIELIFEDDKCDGQEGATVANKLINIDKVTAIVGTMCSASTLAMAPLAEQSKTLLVSSGASAPKIRDAGDYIFSIYPLDNFEAGLIADFAHSKLNRKSAAILYANNDYGLGGKDVLEEKFKTKGGSISIEESYLVGAKDFRIELTKIKSSGADVLFIWGQPTEMVSILKQKKELGLNIQVLASSVAIETDDLKKSDIGLAEGVIYTAPETVSNANSEYLSNAYYDKYQKSDNIFSALGYDVVLLVSDAMKNVETDTVKMKDYLYTINNFLGASGNMSFDKDGSVIKDFLFKTVKNGQFVPYEN